MRYRRYAVAASVLMIGMLTVNAPRATARAENRAFSGVPSHSASSMGGYAYHQTVVVKGGIEPVGGSLNIPAAADSSDYVVMLHLTGSQAASVYNHASYNATRTFAGISFADVTMWYSPARGIWRQIDIDADPFTYGPWSRHNITLWFRLQAPLAAAPASDDHYMLRWGNRDPNVMRAWGDIYPFQDNFSGTTLDPAKWTFSGHTSAALTNGILTLTAYNFGDSGLFSTAAFGPGYQVSMRARLPVILGGGHAASLREWARGGTTADLIAVGYDPSTSPNTYSVGAHDAASNSWSHALIPLQTNDGYHIFSLARDTLGVAHAWVDGATAFVPDYNMRGAFNVMLDGDNAADGMSTSLQVDWLKVWPWIAHGPVAVMK